ncbi:MAG: ABC transporter permease [Saprospiraceae bacterium]
MIQNNLKLALRNLRNNKVNAAINIVGLAIGVAVCLLLLNFIQFQRSYDNFQVNADRIFRVPMTVQEKGGVLQTFAFTYPAVGPALKKDFPEVEDFVRLRFTGGLAKRGEVNEQVSGCFADASFFEIFSYKMLEGDPKTCFSQPYSAVLTPKMAEHIFGRENPFGQSFKFRDREWTVRGVLENPPVNSHLYMRLGMLLDYPTYVKITKENGGDAEGSWGWSDFYTYLLLRPGTDPKALEAKLPAFTERYMGETMKKESFAQHFILQHLLDIHLSSNYDYELAGNGDFKFIYGLGAVGLLILLIAWLNYVNLATARAIDRGKEVGMRKVSGATAGQLIGQFLTEAVLVNVLAIALGAVLFALALNTFANLVDRTATDLLPKGLGFWAMLVAMFGLGALLAGLYPARILASFNPVYSLKNMLAKGTTGGKARLRKTLVVSQFSIAILLVTGVLALFFQLQYMQKQSLGVNIDQTLVLRETATRRDSSGQAPVRSFLNEAGALAGVVSTTKSTGVPGEEIGNSTDFKRMGTDQNKRCRTLGVDHQFIEQYQIQMLAGRGFSENSKADEKVCILNETAVKILGFKNAADALGQLLVYSGDSTPISIVGVVKDYHQESLRHSFDPTVFYTKSDDWDYYSLKVNSVDIPVLMTQVQGLWKKHFPDVPMNSFFLDTYFERQYQMDKMFGAVLLGCTALALLVACLGLFGLSLFTIAKREKEIGIRKALGASVAQVISLVTREYVWLILIAGAITMPIAVFGVQKFLGSYAFHIQLGWWFYILPAAVLLVIAFLTTVGQSWRAALANPVKSLRSE